MYVCMVCIIWMYSFKCMYVCMYGLDVLLQIYVCMLCTYSIKCMYVCMYVRTRLHIEYSVFEFPILVLIIIVLELH